MTETLYQQLPPNARSLEPQHLEHLKKSGLTEETIKAAGIYSVTDPEEAKQILGWKGNGPVPSIAFPHYDFEGNEYFCVLRPDSPIPRNKGKAPKYESPLGDKPRLYFPPSALIPKDTWSDPNQPIIVVEGIKKALASVQAGVPAISAQGVTVWHDIEHREQTNLWELHPDFKNVTVKGRTIYIAFDGRDTEHNAPVILAEARLAAMLVDAGADVRLIRIPYTGSEKVGLDDFLSTQENPVAALQQLLEDSISGNVMERAQELIESETPEISTAQLLRDKSFIAAYRCANIGTQEAIRSILKKAANISKTAVEQTVEEFRQLFVHKSGEIEDHNETDPTLYQEAEELLQSPDLINKLLSHIKNEGLVGEKTAAKTILLTGVSRMLTKPLHAVVKAASSSGKNFTVGCVMKCFPPNDVKEISDMSPKALMYLKEGLKHKIVVVAETDGAERAEYSMRTAMSEGRLTLLVPEKNEQGVIETREHVVEGPPCFIMTTTRGKLHDENETRLIEINLDESEEQTGNIISALGSTASNPQSSDQKAALAREREVIRTALGSLKPYEVRIPQAPDLAASFPKNLVRRRRDFSKMLSLTAAHALLHQRQRYTENDVLMATDEDVAVARELCKSLMSNIPIRLKSLAEKLMMRFGNSLFTAKEAATAVGQSPDAITRRLKELLDCELVELAEQGRSNKASKWKMISDSSIEPTASEIQGVPENKKTVTLVAVANADAQGALQNNIEELRPLMKNVGQERIAEVFSA